jgi:hypothetical protein
VEALVFGQPAERVVSSVRQARVPKKQNA